MPTSFGNVAKEFLYQKTKYSEPYSFISLMGGLLDIIFFFLVVSANGEWETMLIRVTA